MAVSAAPVTVQDGALNVSGNFWVNLNKLFVDSSGGNIGIGTSTPSGKLEVIGAIKSTDWSNVTALTLLLTTIFSGDVSGTYNALQVTDNSHSLHWDNVSNKPANLDIDSTNDLTTSTVFGGDVSGTYNAIVLTDNSHLLNYNNVTGANSSVSQVINDTTDLINNNTDAKLEDLQVTGGLSVGSPETAATTGRVLADNGADIAIFGENAEDYIQINDNNLIVFVQNGLGQWLWNSSTFYPNSDGLHSIGLRNARMKEIHAINSFVNVNSGVSSSFLTHALTVGGQNAIRIIGPTGSFLWDGKINFGDGDLVYIKEPTDDVLELRANNHMRLNGTVRIPGIAAGAGTDYVCISTTGQLSSGASCTKFEGLQASSEVLTDDQFKVKNILSLAYPSDFPLGDLRGKVKEYIYTVAFNLQGVTMEGTIKVPGNMNVLEIPYYLKQKIQAERGVNSLVETQASSVEMGKVYALSQVEYVQPQVTAIKG